MSNPDDSYFAEKDEDEDGVSARESISLLAHDIRMDILLAMIENRHPDSDPQSYSELMDAAGIEDSGQFNYHLEKFVGRYVRKVEDGYFPMASVTHIYRAVLANRPMSDPDRTEFETGYDCPECGSELEASYPKEFLKVSCPDCEKIDSIYPFPKNGLRNREDKELVNASVERVKHHVNLARKGQCPFCAGKTEVEILPENFDDDIDNEVKITCETCSFMILSSILFTNITDPEVVSALENSGVDIKESNVWELPDTSINYSEEEGKVEVEVETPQGEVTIVVDEDLKIKSVSE